MDVRRDPARHRCLGVTRCRARIGDADRRDSGQCPDQRSAGRARHAVARPAAFGARTLPVGVRGLAHERRSQEHRLARGDLGHLTANPLRLPDTEDARGRRGFRSDERRRHRVARVHCGRREVHLRRPRLQQCPGGRGDSGPGRFCGHAGSGSEYRRVLRVQRTADDHLLFVADDGAVPPRRDASRSEGRGLRHAEDDEDFGCGDVVRGRQATSS